MNPIVDPEFKALIPPLTVDELFQLETNITREQCREPLVVWEGRGILLDGHNRLTICDRHGMKYSTIEYPFADRDDAKLWIIKNQFGRRNLTDFQRSELAMASEAIVAAKAKARQVETLKQGNSPVVQNSAQREEPHVKTRDVIAKMAGVSHDTIEKVRRIKTLGIPELVEATRRGDLSIYAAADVATLPIPEQQAAVVRGPQTIKDTAKIIRHTQRTTEKPSGVRKMEAALAKLEEQVAKPMMQISIVSLRANVAEIRAAFARLCEMYRG